MGFLDPKALRDWIKSRAVNNLMATAKGFFLDARVGPVIQEKIDEVKEKADEINGNLGGLSGWIPYSNSFNLEFINGMGTVTIPGRTILATSLAVWSIWSPGFNGMASAVNGKIQITGYQNATPVDGTQWIALAGLIKVQ